jgi:hypothetical protein
MDELSLVYEIVVRRILPIVMRIAGHPSFGWRGSFLIGG